MKKKRRASYAKKAGLPPESLVYTGNRKPSPAEMDILVFDEGSCKGEHIADIRKLAGIIDKTKTNLLIVNNLTDVGLIENLGKFFNIAPMILEDVLNTSHPPKVEESGDQLLFTLKLMDYSLEGGITHQHLSLILGEYYVIIFKDFEDKLFEDIRTRIINGKSKARQKKADYLFYLLTDTLVDSYYKVVDEINNEIDKKEATLLEKPEPNYIEDLYLMKQTMSEMRVIIYPVREALLNIVQGDYSLIEDSTITYLQDVRDHINHIIQMYETCRDTLSDLIELNNSNVNNRLNRSMKVLTIITTLFIPLTLIAGIYGMNFRYMPELSWKVGYPMVILLMLITSGIMLYIMKMNKLL